MHSPENKTRGIHNISMHGTVYSLQYTWSELAELETLYGAAGPQLGNMKVLAAVAAIGMRARHPEVTADSLESLSPPLFKLQAAVTVALRYAYWGDDQEPEETEAAISGNQKKKVTVWRKWRRWLSGMAYRPANSGN